jgi:L-ascorbate metabolism protein UlaG (beta-lactamase superfamily)
LSDGKAVTIDAFTFHGVPAKHNEIERDENGNCKFMGYVIEFGEWKIYHSGDTLEFDNMVEILKPFNVDVALLPINGNDPSRGVAGNLNIKEAAELGKTIGAKIVVPCHYDMLLLTPLIQKILQEKRRRFISLIEYLKLEDISAVKKFRLLLNTEQSVQECDATKV